MWGPTVHVTWRWHVHRYHALGPEPHDVWVCDDCARVAVTWIKNRRPFPLGRIWELRYDTDPN